MIAINGKFLSSRQTGVQRTARQLVCALDEVLLEIETRSEWELLCPPGTAHTINLKKVKVREVGRRGGQIWEQISLPAAARGQTLVSLANSAPLIHNRNVVMIHDCQVFDAPASYSRLFRAWYRFLHPQLGHRARKVFTVSKFSADRIAHHNIVSRDKISVLHNSVSHLDGLEADKEILEKLKIQDTPFALSFASCQPHKNVEVLHKVFSEQDLGCTLVLVGKAPPHGVKAEHGNVVYTGAISDEALKALYGAARVFLFPSLIEGFGLPVGEALSCNCPVIASDIPVMRELWGESISRADPLNAYAWRCEILRIINSDTNCFEALKEGRIRVNSFSWRKSAEVLLKHVCTVDEEGAST